MSSIPKPSVSVFSVLYLDSLAGLSAIAAIFTHMAPPADKA